MMATVAHKKKHGDSLREQVLREWNALPRAQETLERRAVTSVAVSVPKLLKTMGLDERWRQNQIASAWGEIVGETIARHAQPTACHGNSLVVGVDHSTWLRELTYLKPDLLGKLQARFGAHAPRDIIFRIR